MISKNMQDAINEQINKELFSAYLYLSMAAYFEDKNLPGFAHWMTLQAQEEQEHAMKFYAFLNDRGGRVLLKAIDAPQTEWKASMEVFKEVYFMTAEVFGYKEATASIWFQVFCHQ